MKGCPKCGTPAHVDAQFCSQCGHQFSTQFNQTQMLSGYGYGQQPPPGPYAQYPRPPAAPGVQFPSGTYSTGSAIILAILIGPWLGMMVNKQVVKGVVVLLAGMVFAVITGCLGLLIWYPLGIADVVCIANRLNRGEPVREWQFF